MNAEIDISNIELETERLILRSWRLTDLDDFFEYASVDGICLKHIKNKKNIDKIIGGYKWD